MPTINANRTTPVSIAAGYVLQGSGPGTAVIASGANAGFWSLQAGDDWEIGPFSTAATVEITATQAAITYTVVDGEAGALTQGQADAVQTLVSGVWILDGATAGQSTAWLPLIGGGFRLAYALDSGTTTTGFSVDISADGVTSLGQAFTGTWASSTVYEDTGQRTVSNVNARFFRFNVLSGGPLSVQRLA